MYNNYCYRLNFNFDLSLDNLTAVQQSYKNLDQVMIFNFPLKTVDVNLLKFLEPLGLIVSHCEAFYTPPNDNLLLHVDRDQPNNDCKLNWVYGATGSVMEWWIPKDPDQPLNVKTNPTGYHYIEYSKKDCSKVWSAEIGKPSMINSGVPHSVSNTTSEQRWCYSHVIFDKKSNNILQWKDAVGIFEPWII
jgi:hypothetical protein